MATHSSILAWRIPGTAEPGGLPSVGSHRVRLSSRSSSESLINSWSSVSMNSAFTDSTNQRLNSLHSIYVVFTTICIVFILGVTDKPQRNYGFGSRPLQ